jgi:hypothetical protein
MFPTGMSEYVELGDERVNTWYGVHSGGEPLAPHG